MLFHNILPHLINWIFSSCDSSSSDIIDGFPPCISSINPAPASPKFLSQSILSSIYLDLSFSWISMISYNCFSASFSSSLYAFFPSASSSSSISVRFYPCSSLVWIAFFCLTRLSIGIFSLSRTSSSWWLLFFGRSGSSPKWWFSIPVISCSFYAWVLSRASLASLASISDFRVGLCIIGSSFENLI